MKRWLGVVSPTLRCFNARPHEPHGWVFYYAEDTPQCQCPGVSETSKGLR